MVQFPSTARRRNDHELTIRNVVDLAHEVCVHLCDDQVIFGSVSHAANSSVSHAANREARSFRIRPWGVAESIAISFDDVTVARTVKQMGWQRHRAIAAAQQAGVFANVRRAPK